MAQEGNLLVNGSFETGPTVPRKGWTQLKGAAGKALQGWIVSRGDVNYVTATAYPAADGKACLDLYGGIKQTFTTVKGQKYRVDFSLSVQPGEGLQRVGVQAAGQKTEFEVNGGKNKGGTPVWHRKTWDFVAAKKATTLEIYSLVKPTPKNGPKVDRIAVIAIAAK